MHSHLTGIAFSTYSQPVHPFGSPITTVPTARGFAYPGEPRLAFIEDEEEQLGSTSREVPRHTERQPQKTLASRSSRITTPSET